MYLSKNKKETNEVLIILPVLRQNGRQKWELPDSVKFKKSRKENTETKNRDNICYGIRWRQVKSVITLRRQPIKKADSENWSSQSVRWPRRALPCEKLSEPLCTEIGWLRFLWTKIKIALNHLNVYCHKNSLYTFLQNTPPKKIQSWITWIWKSSKRTYAPRNW